MICNICPAALDALNGSDDAVNSEGHKPVIEGALCSVRQKPLTKFRLAGQFNRVPPNTGFFTSIAAVYEYGGITAKRHKRECHKNERRWQGVRMIEPAWMQSSLLSQAFKPMFEDCSSLSLPLAKDGSAGVRAERSSDNLLIQAWDELCLSLWIHHRSIKHGI